MVILIIARTTQVYISCNKKVAHKSSVSNISDIHVAYSWEYNTVRRIYKLKTSGVVSVRMVVLEKLEREGGRYVIVSYLIDRILELEYTMVLALLVNVDQCSLSIDI